MYMTKGIRFCLVLIAITSSGLAATLDDRKAVKKAFDNCHNELSWTCLKLEFVKLMERLSEQREFNIWPGLTIVRNANSTDQKNTEIIAEIARSFPNDPNQRLNGFIIAKLSNLLESYYMRFKLLDSTTVADARSAVTGRKGKFGKKGGMEALIAAAVMMKGTLLAIGMGVLALMAGKALMTALMALTLSGVVGLKALASGGGKSTTYEIVAKPVYTSSHSHSVSHEDGHTHGGHYSAHSGSGYGGGYGRSLNLDLPNHIKAPELETF